MALAYPLIAAFLLTGGRQKEVLGLRLQDVSTDRNTVTFRPNEFHEGGRLKTRTSTRDGASVASAPRGAAPATRPAGD
jgi:hypothetical protein